MAASSDEESQLLSDGDQADSGNEETSTWRRQYYTLPSLRFCNIVKTVIFIDAILSLSLWLAGGRDNEYFIDNIIFFHFMRSTFDLALMAALKLVTLVLLYTFLEDATMTVIEFPYEAPVIKRKKSLHMAVFILSFIYFVYPVVKGALVLNALLNVDTYVKMLLTDNILVICTIVFGLLELIMAVYSVRAMNNLMVIRVLHRINENNQEVDAKGNVITRSASLVRLFKLARDEWKLITSGTFFLILASASQTAAPLLFGKVVDAALHSMHDLNRTILILFSIYIGGSAASMMRSWLFTLAGHRFVARLRKELFNNIIIQEIAFFDTNRTGELTNRLSSDTQVLQNAVTVNISMLIRNFLQIFGSLILMFVLNAQLSGVLLAVVPIVSLGAVQYGRMVMRRQETFQNKLAEASTVAEECISSIRTVRSFVGEPKAQDQYGKSVHDSYKIGAQLAFLQGSFDGLIGTLAYGSITLVLWYGGKLLHEGQISAGLLTSFLLYTLQVAMCFGILSSLYGDFMKAVGASVRIFDLMDRHPSVPTSGGIIPVVADKIKSVSFDNVLFTYPSRPDSEVLQGVTFKMEKGQMIALVGPSGGGKSTIVALIERFYDPDSGKVLIGSEDLKGLDPSWLRKRISIVSQEPTLFACSIKDNISYGKNASIEEVMEAAKLANAHDFVSAFDEGYDTLVGERGVRLSGGQKQRIAIARALIMDPEILLLDEATSALDAESEHLVQEAVDRAMENRTVLVIAHRLSTVRNATKVIVIDKGEIAEEGTHEELLSKEGVYKRLVLRQLMAGAMNNFDIQNGTPNKGNSRNESPILTPNTGNGAGGAIDVVAPDSQKASKNVANNITNESDNAIVVNHDINHVEVSDPVV